MTGSWPPCLDADDDLLVPGPDLAAVLALSLAAHQFVAPLRLPSHLRTDALRSAIVSSWMASTSVPSPGGPR